MKHSSKYPVPQRPAPRQIPLDSLSDEAIESAVLLLALIRRGTVTTFCGGPSLETAYDLHRAALIRLTIDFEPEVGLFWRVA